MAVIKFARRRADMTPDGRACVRLFPSHGQGLTWLYAVRFADGVTKIGVSANPRSRMLHHWAGKRVEWMHLFGCQPNRAAAMCVERDAIRRCALVGQRIGQTEQFLWMSRDETLACVRAAIASCAAPAVSSYSESAKEN